MLQPPPLSLELAGVDVAPAVVDAAPAVVEAAPAVVDGAPAVVPEAPPLLAPPLPAGAFVNAYLGMGDNEQAFYWLEQAYKEQSNILQFLRTHPYFDPIRSDPRFADLVRRVGLA